MWGAFAPGFGVMVLDRFCWGLPLMCRCYGCFSSFRLTVRYNSGLPLLSTVGYEFDAIRFAGWCFGVWYFGFLMLGVL